MVQVREESRFGPCYALGELIGETATRYFYRNRAGPPSSAKAHRSTSRRVRCAPTMSRATRRLRTPAQARRGARKGRALTPTNKFARTVIGITDLIAPNAHTPRQPRGDGHA